MSGSLVVHNFNPVFDERSRVLILGTIPSPKSRQEGFYYGHPRNRFWKVIADLLEEEMPVTIDEKIRLLKKNQIALWDVLQSCEIHGADDSTIEKPVPNPIIDVITASQVTVVFTTGSKADFLYKKHCFPSTNIPSIKLPSTSPANCKVSYEQLKQSYQKILEYR